MLVDARVSGSFTDRGQRLLSTEISRKGRKNLLDPDSARQSLGEAGHPTPGAQRLTLSVSVLRVPKSCSGGRTVNAKWRGEEIVPESQALEKGGQQRGADIKL